MQAITVVGAGDATRLELASAPDPRPAPGQVRIDVRATAVNRADLLQRRGQYPPPPGASPILGLECAGVIAELGAGVGHWRVGDRVMALLAGGGYAEQAVCDAGSLLAVPEGMGWAAAAAVPEVFLTCSSNLLDLAQTRPGEWVLVHGGGSGIGTAAIQLLREVGAHTLVTCGTDLKAERCLALGAGAAVNYRRESFADRALAASGGRGVDVLLDTIGGQYAADHLRCLAPLGRWILIGLLGGRRATLDLGLVLGKRLRIQGSTLRGRSTAEKAAIVRTFHARFGAALAAGRIRPIVDRVLPLARAQEAHAVVERSEHFGKVVLQVR